jgi:hypothetical protein
LSAVAERLRSHGAALAALAICAVHFGGFDFRTQPILTDVKYFLYFAFRVAQGEVPHLHLFDNKTQLASLVGGAVYALADGLGLDPLMAIRVAYLGIAATGGFLLFFVLRRLGGDSGVAGLLGTLAYCTFGFLGVLPAVGNIPKLIMAVCATAMALLVERSRWFWAGAAGAVAFMDWQVGALVGLAALASAALYGAPRLRACLAVAAGGAAGLAPFLLYYAVHGALGAWFGQVVVASFFRGTTALASRTVGDRVDRIDRLVDITGPGRSWLFFLGAAGILVAAAWLWRGRSAARARLLFPLLAYHLGVLAFSLLDFQWYGDFFLILHSAAFFLGLVWVAIYRAVADRLTRPETAPAGLRRAVAAAALIGAVALARPGPLRPEYELQAPLIAPGTTLADQVAVADYVMQRIEGRTAAFFWTSDLLFLARKANPLPVIYWNDAAWSYFRASPQEPKEATVARLIDAAGVDIVVFSPHWFGRYPLFEDFDVVHVTSDNGKYGANVATRRPRATDLP